jgi:hypothetical protein
MYMHMYRMCTGINFWIDIRRGTGPDPDIDIDPAARARNVNYYIYVRTYKYIYIAIYACIDLKLYRSR